MVIGLVAEERRRAHRGATYYAKDLRAERIRFGRRIGIIRSEASPVSGSVALSQPDIVTDLIRYGASTR